MHFAFVLYRYFPHGGLQKDFLRTLQEALLRGHKVTAFFAVQEAPLEEAENFRIVKLPVSGLSNHSRMKNFSTAVNQALEQERFDRVLMFNRMPGGDFYFAADNCLAADWGKLHAPWVLKLLPRYRTFLELERQVFAPESKTRILALTEKQVRDYRSFYHTQSEKFSVMPAGIDDSCRRSDNASEIRKRIREQYNIPQQAILLVQAAAQFGVKGVDRSIKALADLRKKSSLNAYLLVAGSGEIEKYQTIAAENNIAGQVIFAGGCSNIPELLMAADLMIHPARKEATGTVIVEALAVGLPVIASAACGYSDYTARYSEKLVTPEPFKDRDLEAALAFAVDNLETLTEKVMRSANSSDFYRRAGEMIDLLERS